MREDFSSVLAELQSVDRKAYKLTSKKREELDGLERILGSDERLLWVQPLTLIADPDGEITTSMMIHVGVAALTDIRMLFLSESATAHWAYEDMSAVADAKPLGGCPQDARYASGRAALVRDRLPESHGHPPRHPRSVDPRCRHRTTRYRWIGRPRGVDSGRAGETRPLHQQGLLNDAQFESAKSEAAVVRRRRGLEPSRASKCDAHDRLGAQLGGAGSSEARRAKARRVSGATLRPVLLQLIQPVRKLPE